MYGTEMVSAERRLGDLNGGVATAGDDLFTPLVEYLERYAWTPWGSVRVRPGECGEDSAVLGLAAIARRNDPGFFRPSPALVTIFLFTFVATWTNFMLPLVMLSDQSLYPVTLGLYSWQSFKGAASYDIVLTGSLLAVIPLVLLFLSLQRFWQSGLTMGGVKG